MNKSTQPILITFDGKTMSIRAWARHLSMNEQTLQYRIKAGWPVEKALCDGRYGYRVHVSDRAERLSAYQSHIDQLQQQLTNAINTFVRKLDNDAHKLRRQMQAMIVDRVRMPDDVVQHRGVVKLPAELAPDRTLSSTQETT